MQYPDSGHPLDDKAILRSAVQFGTAQRAFTAELILSQPLDYLGEAARSFLTVNAFVAEMVAYEDFLGWLLVLEGWKPGDFQTSLVRLLDRTLVKPEEEDHLDDVSQSSSVEDLRRILHIPLRGDLVARGFREEHLNRIDNAIPANLYGIRRAIARRKEQGRGLVQAYNKIKHLMLAVPAIIESRPGVLVPKFYDFDVAAKTVRLKTVTLRTDPETIRSQARRAIITEAVLNSLLGVILWSRYDEPYESPTWAVRALSFPDWATDPDSSG